MLLFVWKWVSGFAADHTFSDYSLQSSCVLRT